MPQKLFNIAIDEISLVDRPANKGARVMLFKRDGSNRQEYTMQYENPMTGAMVTIAKAVVQHGFAPPSLERCDVYEALCDGARTIAVDGETFEQSFARFISKFDDGRALMVAYRKARGPDRKKRPVNTMAKPEPEDDDSAMSKLCEVAEMLRKQQPELSPAQAFSRVWCDPCPEARQLVAQEKRERLAKIAAATA